MQQKNTLKLKTSIKHPFLVPALIAGLFIIQTISASAQSFSVIHAFTAVDTNDVNSDGGSPWADLLVSSNTLYGTAEYGGAGGNGTVFKMNLDGTGFTVLHSFGPTAPDSNNNYTNADGAFSQAGLVLSGNTLYGTTQGGGAGGNGTVFKVNTDGTGFEVLHDFAALDPITYTNSDGTYPEGTLCLSNGMLYGIASSGGANGSGTVFKLSTNGTGFVVLHMFSTWDNTGSNPDGADPLGGVILAGNTLYGTANYGGIKGNGNVFKVDTDGSNFGVVYAFTNGVDGSEPDGQLTLSGDTLYGTDNGGTGSAGLVFAVSTNGTGFTALHQLATNNLEGVQPEAKLFLSGNTLYGNCISGGFGDDSGTVFGLQTNGAGFTVLHSFSTNAPDTTSGPYTIYTNYDGDEPQDGMVLVGNNLYGTTTSGGGGGEGTIFKISLFGSPVTFQTNGLNWTLNGDTVNGGPVITNYTFTPTDGTGGENRSAWFSYPLYVGSFDASFTYQDVGTNGADGTAFVIQNDPAGTAAIGGGGGGLGYIGITNSVAVMLDIYSGAPGGPSGFLVATNGQGDGAGYSSSDYQSTAPVNLDGGNPIDVHLHYAGGVLQISFTNTVTLDTFQTNVAVDISAFTGTNVAYVGFTGSEGAVISHQTVSDFSYMPLPPLAANAAGANTLALTWPEGIYGFHLQSTTNLDGGTWTDMSEMGNETNGLNQALVPKTTPAQFFRLVSP